MVDRVLTAYVSKWKVRCTMVSAVDEAQKKERLLEEYRELVGTEQWRCLRREDMYLRWYNQAPKPNTKVSVLTELVRTCRMATEAEDRN